MPPNPDSDCTHVIAPGDTCAFRAAIGGPNPDPRQPTLPGVDDGPLFSGAVHAPTPANYTDFIRSKAITADACGFEPPDSFPHLFDYQEAIAKWAIRRGRAAIFALTGLGKTAMQLTWAREVVRRTGRSVIVLAPLAVAPQTEREAKKFEVAGTRYIRDKSAIDGAGIYVTNYEMLSHFDASAFGGVVIDESSIVKHHEAATRNLLIETFSRTPYRLACTATPAPNDWQELGNHAEFLGIMTRVEMLSMFFVHDGSEGAAQGWRLKGHAQESWWRWVCSWACMIRRPSDLGFDDAKLVLPPMHVKRHVVSIDRARALGSGALFVEEAATLSEQRAVRRASLPQRVSKTAEVVNAEPGEQWIVWGDLNDETDALTAQIKDAVQIKGADSRDEKEDAILRFIDGKIRVIVSKTSIFGFGLNLQMCARMAFCGVTHSWESYFQAVRRVWRFGQKREVHVHVVSSDAESRVIESLMRKEDAADEMAVAMIAHMRDAMAGEIKGAMRVHTAYQPKVPMAVPKWLIENAGRR